VELLRQQGAGHVLSSSDRDFPQQLQAICQSLGATLALDAVAGEMTGILLEAMPPGGRVVIYGTLSGDLCSLDADRLIFGDKRVEGFWLAKTVAQGNPLLLLVRAFALQRALADDLRTTVRARVGLADVGQALAAYKGDMSRGKILIVPGLG
jgi:NADPH:quinone reductase-like Zn-dependent oxidoreductase